MRDSIAFIWKFVHFELFVFSIYWSSELESISIILRLHARLLCTSKCCLSLRTGHIYERFCISSEIYIYTRVPLRTCRVYRNSDGLIWSHSTTLVLYWAFSPVSPDSYKTERYYGEICLWTIFLNIIQYTHTQRALNLHQSSSELKKKKKNFE